MVKVPSVVFPALLYGLTGLVCTQIPLLNYLGFEFSFVLALAGSLIAGFAVLRAVPRADWSSPWPQPWDVSAVWRTFRRTLFLHGLLLFVPLVIILANSYVVPNCSVEEGVAFFVLLPVVSILFSSALALFCSVHYRHRCTVFVLMVAASLGYALALGYTTPAIFSYNFFYGYFPGLSYDEVLPLQGTLVLFRAITLAAGAVLLWWAWILLRETKMNQSTTRKGRTLLKALAERSRRAVTLVVAASAILLWIFRCELGFESTASYVQRILGGRLETQNFILYYDSRSLPEKEIKRIAWEHEFRFRQVLAAFSLPHDAMVTSYLYPDAETKRRLVGTGTTNIAKPWNREVHLTVQSMESTLKHELVHVIAGRFGVPVLHASLSTGLVEGVAMAIENNPGNRTLHEYAAAMQAQNAFPSITSLMSLSGFASQTSSVSYILAGSFTRFLIDRYGIRRVMQVYRTGDYEMAFGRRLDRLVGEWEEFLGTVEGAKEDSGRVDALFRRPPIFGKVCARVLARRMREAGQVYAERRYAEALPLYEEIYAQSQSMDAWGGILRCSFHLRHFRRVRISMHYVQTFDARPLRYIPYAILAGDAAWGEGDTLLARRHYQTTAVWDITDGFTEAALIRMAFLRRPRTGRLYLEYLLNDPPDSLRGDRLAAIAELNPRDPVPRYVQGRLLQRLGRFDEALDILSSLSMAEVHPYLEHLRLRSRGEVLYRLRRYEEARGVFWTSLNWRRGAQTQALIEDWIDRCGWMQRSLGGQGKRLPRQNVPGLIG